MDSPVCTPTRGQGCTEITNINYGSHADMGLQARRLIQCRNGATAQGQATSSFIDTGQSFRKRPFPRIVELSWFDR